MQFKGKLYKMLRTIHEAKEEGKNGLMERAVKERLDSALSVYQSSLSESYEYLSSKDSLNVMKKMNRGS